MSKAKKSGKQKKNRGNMVKRQRALNEVLRILKSTALK